MISVTGAAGFVGRHVVLELLARGYRVRGLMRDAAKARQAFGSPTPAGLEFAFGDICDARALGELVRGTAACIHLVGIIRESRGGPGEKPQTFERIHEQGTRAITEACRDAGVKRYLHMSALGVSSEGRSLYQKSKFEAEQIVRRSSLDWTIFRPSLIHGPEGEFVQMIADIASGEVAPWFFIPYFVRSTRDQSVPGGAVTYTPANIQPVAVEDVAKAFVTAIEKPLSICEIYNLVGSEVLNWQELSEFMRDALPGTKKQMGTWHVPGEHAAVMATVAGAIGLGGLLPFDAGQAIMATEDSTADLYKVRADLGIEPKPFRATVRAYASQV